MSIASINGINLYYETHGDANNPPLLLLHGLGSSARDWEYQIPTFTEQYYVIATDQRGFGRSEKPKGLYAIEQFADDAFAVMDYLGFDAFHLLGYSMGGAVAYQMVVSDINRVKRLVIVNSLPSFSLDRPRAWYEYLMRLAVVNTMGLDKMSKLIAKRLFPKPEQQGLREKVGARFADNEKAAYIAAVRGMTGWTVAEHLPTMDLPALLISAEKDYFPLSVKQEYAAQMPNARLEVIEDSLHGTPFDQPHMMNTLVMDFLQST